MQSETIMVIIFWDFLMFDQILISPELKQRMITTVAVTDMRYFPSSKLSRSLVHKKKFSLIWQVVFKSAGSYLGQITSKNRVGTQMTKSQNYCHTNCWSVMG